MVTRYLVMLSIAASVTSLNAQRLEFETPVRLPAVINSSAEESMPLLSPDGMKLYFSRSLFTGNEGGKFAGPDIWVSERRPGGWGRSSNSIKLNNRNNNIIVGINPRMIYFVNSSGWERTEGVYSTSVSGGRSTRPQLLAIPGIENRDFLGFYVSPDEDVIFLSMKADDSRGNEDIYFSVKGADGQWTKPKNVGSTVNTAGFEISPFLSYDKKRLYFASNGHEGMGDADIFYCERLYDSWETWSAPVNLGESINSRKFDAFFSIYGDTVAYLSSNRDGKLADIYSVKVRVVKTILADGQHYLTDDEWNTQIGRNVSRRIAFEKNSTALSPAQKELLFYIVNKVMLKRDIRFHVVIREEDDPTLTAKRLEAVCENLTRSGIDPLRINKEQVDASKKSDRGVIEILLLQ